MKQIVLVWLSAWLSIKVNKILLDWNIFLPLRKMEKNIWRIASLVLVSLTIELLLWLPASLAQVTLQMEKPHLAPLEKSSPEASLPNLGASHQENGLPVPIGYAPSITYPHNSVFQSLDSISVEGWSSTTLSIRSINNQPQPPTTTVAQATSLGSASRAAWQFDDELLAEFGLVSRAQKMFYRGQRQIIVDVYYFSSTVGAYGSYCCLRQGASNPVLTGDASSEDDQGISFWKDHFFVHIAGTSQEDEESKTLITKLANQVATLIKASSPKPAILLRLPLIERVHGSERIAFGPIGLKKLFPAPYINLIGSDGPLCSVIADYQIKEPYPERLKLLITEYGVGPRAALVFAKYVGQLSQEHKPEKLSGFTYQTSVFKIANGYILCQMRGNEILVISGSRKKQSLSLLCQQIY